MFLFTFYLLWADIITSTSHVVGSYVFILKTCKFASTSHLVAKYAFIYQYVCLSTSHVMGRYVAIY